MKRFRMKGLWLFLAAAVGFAPIMQAPPAAAEQDVRGAVIFMYHRFGEGDYPSTNVTMEQFHAHVAELKSGGYTVMPVPEIARRLREGAWLPEKAIGITIDDAYASVYERAWPVLRAANLPFTLFVATEPVDRGYKGMMTWEQIREMKAAGVDIGAHTVSHHSMPSFDAARNRAEIIDSNRRFAEELEAVPELFAYPYGEASLEAREIVREEGYRTAFGQHSGVTHAGEDQYYLPRFALNERFGDMDRFKMAAHALPLPVTDVMPADMLVDEEANPPLFGFTVAGNFPIGALSCFASHEGKARMERIGRRAEVRFENPFPEGRTRVNCTLPGPDGRWHWYGRQFFRK